MRNWALEAPHARACVRAISAIWCQGRNATERVLDVQGNFLRLPWARLKAHLKLVGDKQFVPHVLRHTFASLLVQEGAHPLKVQKLMGHKTLAMTQRYSHLAPDDLFGAVELLDRRIGGADSLSAINGGMDEVSHREE